MSVYYKENPAFLSQAIESMQKQTLLSDNFVLVCDGPLNRELDAVIASKQQEMGATLHVVRLEKNGGLGRALNEGLRHCRHELVARMDSDDIAYPDRCEEQIAVFCRHPEVSICSGTVEEIDKKLKVLEQACDTQSDEAVREALKQVVPTYCSPKEANARAAQTADLRTHRQPRDHRRPVRARA